MGYLAGHKTPDLTLRASLLLLLCFSFAGIQLAHAQQEPAEEKGFWARWDSTRRAKVEQGRPLFSPYIAPSFTPELGFFVSGGGLYSFATDPDNPDVDRSSIPFGVGVSTNGSVFFNSRPTIYGKGDKLRAIGDFWFRDQPDHYFGVGYDNARNTELSDSTTAYRRQWIRAYMKGMMKVRPNLFWGMVFDFNRTTATDLNPQMEMDPAIVEYGTKVTNTGLGLSILFDSRDLIQNPYKGMLLDLNFLSYGQIFGGENNYQVIDMDYRQYANVGKPRRTLAWEMRFRHTFNDAPWPELSQVGTPFDLRGYRWGRFRDEAMFFSIVEYRHMLTTTSSGKGWNFMERSGLVAWVAGATIGQSVNDFDQWLPNFGLGYRFEVEDRMNLRFDYGVGIDSSFFYISFNEAF